MSKRKRAGAAPKPAPVSIVTRSGDSQSPGCLYTIVMVALGLWIAFFPKPYPLAVGIGMIVPPLAFMLWGPGQRGFTSYEPPAWQGLLCCTSAFLVAGLAYRWWDEYSLIAPLPWAIASQLCAAALLLAAHRYRPSELLVWRAACFALYVGSSLGLVNKHLDTSIPHYVQGKVVDENFSDGEGGFVRHYALVAPYLDWPDHTIAVPEDQSRRLVLGAPVCTARHAGWLGMPWSSHAPGLCDFRKAAASPPSTQGQAGSQ